MADQRQLLDLDWPPPDEVLEELSQEVAVVTDVAAAVVADVDGREAEIGSETRAERERTPRAPVFLVLTQSVQEDDYAGGGFGEGLGQGGSACTNIHATLANRHRDCEVVALVGEPVADHRVEEADHKAAAARGVQRSDASTSPGRASRRRGRRGGRPGAHAEAGVNRAGDSVVDGAGRHREWTERCPDAPGDGAVQRFRRSDAEPLHHLGRDLEQGANLVHGAGLVPLLHSSLLGVARRTHPLSNRQSRSGVTGTSPTQISRPAA